MASKNVLAVLICLLVAMATLIDVTNGMSTKERRGLRDQVVEMFNHAYNSYMTHAYPADELMPLSCKGRYRGRERSRGDIDECMGNFSLTLIDSLDTLAIFGKLDEFENAVRLVIKNTRFDSDVVVSVFETNIRVLGGLLGGHVMATFLKKKRKGMQWYNNELIDMAREVGMRLLPAFNTTTGIPYPKVNLLHGIDADLRSRYKDTCTACAGTIILEFAALSRLTGESIFEEKARKAMDYLWQQRHRVSDLVGTVINIHNGDWVRRESGVGAGIDSYYEYVLKGYILLGDNTYLERFNKHYDAVMKYISQGPLLVDVHMHRPQSTSRNFMDSLLAFWPGLQVLKGDLKPAIETHEMLFQVIKRHNFLPEAFTTDFRIHWGQHPLRPEFVESTYFLFKATNDPYYLDVGRKVVENLNKHARVPCGFASIKDVTIGSHEDQMDSFVLAETFKYLYLLFAEDGDSVINVDDYIFTTEAHLLPLTLSIFNSSRHTAKIRRESYQKMKGGQKRKSKKSSSESPNYKQTCPNLRYLHRGESNYAHSVREQLKDMVENVSPKPKNNRHRFRAIDFMAGNKEQLEILGRMGIRLMTMTDGRIQLLHTSSEASTPMDADNGMKFMQEMIELSKNQNNEAQHEPLIVQILPPSGDEENSVLSAGPAQFGYNLKNSSPIQGRLMIADPYKACTPLTNAEHIKGHIAVLERGECMFIEKASNIEAAGAIGGIVIDHNPGSSSETSPLFAMSGDGHRDVSIPLVFLFHKEGQKLLESLSENYNMEVLVALDPRSSASQTKTTTTEAPPKTTPIVATNRPRKTFQHLKTIQSFQTPARAIKPEEFLYQPAMDRKPYSAKQEPLILENKNGNYFILVGSNNVFMEISIISLSSSSSLPSQSAPSSNAKKNTVIHLDLLPDGTKRLAFHFAHLSKKEPSHNKPKLNQIYVELVSLLKERTNFLQLDSQSQYLRAITRVLEAVYFNFGKLDANEKVVLDQLSFELIIIKDDSQEKGSTDKVSEVGTEKGAGEQEGGQYAELDSLIKVEDKTEDSSSEISRSEDGDLTADDDQVVSESDDSVYIDKEGRTQVSDKAKDDDTSAEDSEHTQVPSILFGEDDAEQYTQSETSDEEDEDKIPVGSDAENILIVNNDHMDDPEGKEEL